MSKIIRIFLRLRLHRHIVQSKNGKSSPGLPAKQLHFKGFSIHFNPSLKIIFYFQDIYWTWIYELYTKALSFCLVVILVISYVCISFQQLVYLSSLSSKKFSKILAPFVMLSQVNTQQWESLKFHNNVSVSNLSNLIFQLGFSKFKYISTGGKTS